MGMLKKKNKCKRCSGTGIVFYYYYLLNKHFTGCCPICHGTGKID